MLLQNDDKVKKKIREEASSAKAGFYAGPLSWLNWNLEMLVFVEGVKLENPEKNLQSKARTNNKLNPMPGLGIKPGTHWWEVTALTTAPSLLLKLG